MAALAADINTSIMGVPTILRFVANAADIFYKGSICWFDNTTGLVKATMAAGDKCAGISPKQQNVATGGTVELLVDGYVWTPLGGGPIAATDVGEVLMNDGAVNSDNVADMVTSAGVTFAANDAFVARIIKVETARMLLKFEVGGVTGQRCIAVTDLQFI